MHSVGFTKTDPFSWFLIYIAGVWNCHEIKTLKSLFSQFRGPFEDETFIHCEWTESSSTETFSVETSSLIRRGQWFWWLGLCYYTAGQKLSPFLHQFLNLSQVSNGFWSCRAARPNWKAEFWPPLPDQLAKCIFAETKNLKMKPYLALLPSTNTPLIFSSSTIKIKVFGKHTTWYVAYGNLWHFCLWELSFFQMIFWELFRQKESLSQADLHGGHQPADQGGQWGF